MGRILEHATLTFKNDGFGGYYNYVLTGEVYYSKGGKREVRTIMRGVPELDMADSMLDYALDRLVDELKFALKRSR